MADSPVRTPVERRNLLDVTIEHPDRLACPSIPDASDGIEPTGRDQRAIILPADGVHLLRVALLVQKLLTW